MFAISSLSLCLLRGLQTRAQQLLLDCQSFSLCHNKDSFCKVSAGLLPTPASPPIQMTQPKKNLGDSQTDHREGLRYLRSVAKRNAKTLKNQLDLGEIRSNNNWETSGFKTDRKNVCLDDTAPYDEICYWPWWKSPPAKNEGREKHGNEIPW